jgi:hypothetical protein
MAPLRAFSTKSARDGVRRGNASSAHFQFEPQAATVLINVAARSDAALPPSHKVKLG